MVRRVQNRLMLLASVSLATLLCSNAATDSSLSALKMGKMGNGIGSALRFDDASHSKRMHASGGEASISFLSSDQYPTARCLDGSPGAYYLRKGTPGNKTWVFMLEGGGLCSHKDDCTERSTTDLGSSKNYKV